jgi:hypothetical protein
MKKTEYEMRMESVAAIKDEIAQKSEEVHKAAKAVYGHMVTVIDQHLEGGDLQKLAGGRGLLKSANANARAENEALTKLQAEYARELAHANEAFPDHFAQLHEVRGAQVPPAGGGRYFSVIKGGAATPLPPSPGTQPEADLNRSLFDSRLARRFQDREES